MFWSCVGSQCRTGRSPRSGDRDTRPGAAADLFVEAFLGVVGPDLTPVRFGEPGKGEDFASGGVEVVGGVGEADLVEMVDDPAVLSPD